METTLFSPPSFTPLSLLPKPTTTARPQPLPSSRSPSPTTNPATSSLKLELQPPRNKSWVSHLNHGLAAAALSLCPPAFVDPASASELDVLNEGPPKDSNRDIFRPLLMMASTTALFLFSSPSSPPIAVQQMEKMALFTHNESFPMALVSRRKAMLLSVITPATFTLQHMPAEARERRNRKVVSEDEYATSSDGLKYYDLVEGKGPRADKGSTVQVHFDCVYKGITAVSSRESKLLAGNRVIAQPYEFKVGSPPGKERKREYVDNANGLFSAQAAPKPPPAMYSITEGMRVGGKRRIIVPPVLGYGQKGMNEIPPGATFELNVELLQVVQPAEN